MPFGDFIKEKFTGKPANIDGPVFLKETSDAQKQIETLKEFREICPASVQVKIDRDIKLLSYGIYGENQIAFELKNSYLPIIVLHDLHVVHKGLEAQIDYLIITNREYVIVECKNLVGNIDVNHAGDFIRTTIFKGKKKSEGIYNPITQNQRHLQLLKQIAHDRDNNFIRKKGIDLFFEENFKTVVVLANPKTVVNTKYAKKENKDQIIRCDQLNDYLKKMLSESKMPKSAGKEMSEYAAYYLGLHQPNRNNYLKKYGVGSKQKQPLREGHITYQQGDEFIHVLKEYRKKKSKAEGVKAYYVYSNAQMEALVAAKPKTKSELLKIKGFGRVKCEKYGEDLIQIFRRYK